MQNDLYDSFYSFIKKNNLGNIEKNFDIKKHTTLKIGGFGNILYYPYNLNKLKKAFKYIRNKNLDYFVIGMGSNLLFSDDVHRYIFINLKYINNYKLLLENIDGQDTKIYIEAGANASLIARKVSMMGFYGLEFLAGLNASFGGIIYMNAGAWGKQISDSLISVNYLNHYGNVETFRIEDIKRSFDYRKSPFQFKKGIIISCLVKLEEVRDNISPYIMYCSYLDLKKKQQPLEKLSAGCCFMNVGKTKAWELISKSCDLNVHFGDAAISSKHCNFLINKGNASYNDMICLINYIKANVYDKYGILLQTEWQIIN